MLRPCWLIRDAPQRLHQFREPRAPAQQIANHQQGPAVSDDAQGAGNGACLLSGVRPRHGSTPSISTTLAVALDFSNRSHYDITSNYEREGHHVNALASAVDRGHPQKWLILAAMCLGLAMLMIDTFVVNVATSVLSLIAAVASAMILPRGATR